MGVDFVAFNLIIFFSAHFYEPARQSARCGFTLSIRNRTFVQHTIIGIFNKTIHMAMYSGMRVYANSQSFDYFILLLNKRAVLVPPNMLDGIKCNYAIGIQSIAIKKQQVNETSKYPSKIIKTNNKCWIWKNGFFFSLQHCGAHDHSILCIFPDPCSVRLRRVPSYGHAYFEIRNCIDNSNNFSVNNTVEWDR